MTRLFAMLLVSCLAWTLGACGGPDVKTGDPKKTGKNAKTDQPKRTFVRPKTSEFIRDRKVKYVKQGGKMKAIDQGPLLGYQIRLNYALDPDKSSYREGKLEGQTIVFGIPDGLGDTGASFTLAFDRAAEMLARGDLPLSASQSERTVSGAIALVNVISLGYPSGRKKGDKIPVILEPLGNAKSIIGGHFYGTLLQDVGVSKKYNSKGKAEYASGKRLASAGYTQLWPEEVLTRESFFARKTFREIFDPEGTLEEASK